MVLAEVIVLLIFDHYLRALLKHFGCIIMGLNRSKISILSSISR